MSGPPHVPVLLEDVVSLLEPGPGRRILDGTFGFGGHSTALLEAGAEVIGVDLDAEAQTACRELAATRPTLHCHHGSFRDLDRAVAAAGWPGADGVLLDLGVSSRQLDDPAKGFSYRGDGPLDLRFDSSQGAPASELVASLKADELADLFWRWGEERHSRRLARAVVTARAEAPVDTTGRLAAVLTAAVPRGVKPMATLSRVFQALRIAVNDELAALDEALAKMPTVLAAGGRCVVIAYHSLEDRLVKRFIEREKRDCLCAPEVLVCVCGHRRTLQPLTRGALKATDEECRRNPRARSARLRAARRI